MIRMNHKVIANILTWLAAALMTASVATAQVQLDPLERIGVRAGDDGAQFVLKESGDPFFVKVLFWTYDCFEQPRLYHAAKDWTLFVRKMGNFELNKISDHDRVLEAAIPK